MSYSLDFAAHGQVWTSNELRRPSFFFSHSGVQSIWLQHKLACFKDRLKALKEKVAREGIILTEARTAALDKDEIQRRGRR